jgi:hypothetical protein
VKKTIAVAAFALLATGCTSWVGPRYNHHVGNTLELRAAGLDKVSIGEIRKDPEARDDVDQLRSQTLYIESPYGSYTAYLHEALKIEFDHSDLLDAGSSVRIDGVLLRNGFGQSADREFVELEAELTVWRGTEVAYRRTRSARYDWHANYHVAMSRAVANYQAGVQRLIAAFIADPEFVAALRKR